MLEWATTEYRPSDSTHLTMIGDDALLLEKKSEECFQLNSVALEIWRLLGMGMSLDNCVQRLKIRFNVEETVLRADVEQLVSTALNLGLINHPPVPVPS